MEKKEKRRRSNALREDQIVEMVEMEARGHSIREICERFSKSRSQVHRDLKKYYKSKEDEKDETKIRKTNKLLQEMQAAKRELWKGLELSKQDKEIQTKEKITSKPQLGPDGVAQNRGVERNKASIRSEGRLPNCQYITELGKIWDREAKLLGLNNPSKVEVTSKKPIQFIYVEDAKPIPAAANKEESSNPPAEKSPGPAPEPIPFRCNSYPASTNVCSVALRSFPVEVVPGVSKGAILRSSCAI